MVLFRFFKSALMSFISFISIRQMSVSMTQKMRFALKLKIISSCKTEVKNIDNIDWQV